MEYTGIWIEILSILITSIILAMKLSRSPSAIQDKIDTEDKVKREPELIEKSMQIELNIQ